MTDKEKNMSMEKRATSTAEPTRDLPVYVPAADIYEKPDAILVMCDMPGVDEKHVDVSLEDDVLTLVGEQVLAEPQGYERIYRARRPGLFRRSFTLHSEIDRDQIQARVKQGVLSLVLPKSKKARPKKIAVTVES
jgi:HSP20 family protein